MKTVFFGTPEFALPILNALEAAGRTPVAVVCQPDRRSGRGRKLSPPAVKSWAIERGLEVLQPEKQKDPEFLARLEALQPDLGLVAAFGQLITRRALETPRLGFINVHPSLIPKYRGAAPMQWTLLRGDRQGGVSIIKVTPRLDDGDVLLQQAVDIPEDQSLEELHDTLAALGGDLLVQAVEALAQGPMEARPQDAKEVIWAPALTKDDGRLDWSKSALELHNRIRGLQPWPGAWTSTKDRLLKIQRARVESGAETQAEEPGRVLMAEGEHIVIACGEGCLRLLELQIEGKKRLDARSFLQGRPFQVGDLLGL
ncbi:MAG: methionyl-tRNA formyltransferase [Deltaproteobacteria bacterium]|nr:methionyl-tRNA formyltransferase [Deltaproteobacteria bacterium]